MASRTTTADARAQDGSDPPRLNSLLVLTALASAISGSLHGEDIEQALRRGDLTSGGVA